METARIGIVIDKELHTQAKRLAIKQGKTLKQILEDALRIFLGEKQRGRRRRTGFRFRVYPSKVRTSFSRKTIYDGRSR